MIVKLRVTDRPHAAHGGGGWTYIDGVERIDTHTPPADADGQRVPFTGEQLVERVTAMFGPERDYAFEVWPQDMGEGFSRFANIAVARLANDRFALLVLTDEAYLLSDAGHTVDRLYP